MSSESKVPCIPKEGVMSFEDWLAGRKARRESGNLVAPEVIRRRASSSDRRLKKQFFSELFSEKLLFTTTVSEKTGF